MRESFIRQVYKNISVKLFRVLYAEKGLTHIQFVEYFFLLVVIVIIVAVIAIKIPEVQAKIWAKINSDLLK